MKYCYKCGNPMEDDMLFCQKCGTRVIEQPNDEEIIEQNTPQNPSTEKKMEQETTEFQDPESNRVYTTQQTETKFVRKGMKISMFICLAFAVLTLLTEAIYAGQLATGIGLGVFFVILAIMFSILSKSPAENPFILNGQSGLKKKTLVTICIISAFLFSMIFMIFEDSKSTSSEDTNNTEQTTIEETDQQEKTNSENKKSDKENISDKKATLSDVEKWYENQIPAVSQSLIEYTQGVNGISNVNVTDTKFRFGEDSGWYDCHYTVYFTCKVNGDNCTGEARAFLKYNDDQLEWFHFEISRDSDWATIVEQYDDSYDQIIEDYYKELESNYK